MFFAVQSTITYLTMDRLPKPDRISRNLNTQLLTMTAQLELVGFHDKTKLTVVDITTVNCTA